MSKFSSESVSLGHPDALAAYISDSLLHAYLKGDPNSHCGIETLVTGEAVVVGGEVKSSAKIDFEEVVRRAVAEVGYDADEKGVKVSSLSVLNYLHEQSPDIAMGVESQLKEGINAAGDQGMVSGGATTDARYNNLPVAYWLVTRLQRVLWKLHLDRPEEFFPDSKCQITVNEHGQVTDIVASCSNSEALSIEQVRETLRSVINKWIADEKVNVVDDVKYFLNYTGRFCKSGPMADSGVNGRKLVADTYGGYFPIMGGAQTGKDPTKVDRSGAYMSRWLAKAVANHLAWMYHKYYDVSVQAGYCIGYPHPVSCQVLIWDEGGNNVLKNAANKLADLFVSKGYFDVQTMIDTFDLTHYDLRPSVAFGMFTDPSYPWEQKASPALQELIEEAFKGL